MALIHIIMVPIFVIFVSLLLQEILDLQDFSHFYNMFFIGLVIGIIINILFSFINKFYIGKAYCSTILFKSIFFDGLLLSIFIVGSFCFIVDFLSDISVTLDWSTTSIFCFSYISGIYSITNIFNVFSNNTPSSMIFYLPFFSFLLFISILIGLGIPKFIDAYEGHKKLLWALYTVITSTIFFSAFNFFTFYNYYYYYFVIPAFIILFIVFFFVDLKNYI